MEVWENSFIQFLQRQLWVLEKPLKWRKESDFEDEDENEGGGSAKEIDDSP